jgi:hypothetical protein
MQDCLSTSVTPSTALHPVETKGETSLFPVAQNVGNNLFGNGLHGAKAKSDRLLGWSRVC